MSTATARASEEQPRTAAKKRERQESLEMEGKPLRIAELEELGVELIESIAAKKVAEEKRKAAYQDVKAKMTELSLRDYLMFDRPKILSLKARDAEVTIADRDAGAPG